LCAGAQTAIFLSYTILTAVALITMLETRPATSFIAALGRSVKKESEVMLWTILVILLILWLLGFGLGVGGGTNLIHLLLVVAAIVLVYNLIAGRRRTV
jgi:Family of unknown function (DUF5670)